MPFPPDTLRLVPAAPCPHEDQKGKGDSGEMSIQHSVSIYSSFSLKIVIVDSFAAVELERCDHIDHGQPYVYFTSHEHKLSSVPIGLHAHPRQVSHTHPRQVTRLYVHSYIGL